MKRYRKAIITGGIGVALMLPGLAAFTGFYAPDASFTGLGCFGCLTGPGLLVGLLLLAVGGILAVLELVKQKGGAG